MKPIAKLGLVALVVYLLSLLLLFPADRAYSLARERLGIPAVLYQISGSLWNAHIGMAQFAGRQVKDIEWRLHGLPLLAGRIEAGFEVIGGKERIGVIAGRRFSGDLYVHDAGQDIPVAELEKLINPQPLGLSGTLALELDDISLQAGRLTRLNGEVIWHQAGLGAPVNISVGNIVADIATKNDVIQATLKDRDGPLEVDGLLMLMADSSYRLTLTLVVKDKSREDLKQALAFLGSPNRDGKITLSRRGRLNLGFN
jgi:general secretion pathway protein N